MGLFTDSIRRAKVLIDSYLSTSGAKKKESIHDAMACGCDGDGHYSTCNEQVPAGFTLGMQVEPGVVSQEFNDRLVNAGLVIDGINVKSGDVCPRTEESYEEMFSSNDHEPFNLTDQINEGWVSNDYLVPTTTIEVSFTSNEWSSIEKLRSYLLTEGEHVTLDDLIKQALRFYEWGVKNRKRGLLIRDEKGEFENLELEDI